MKLLFFIHSLSSGGAERVTTTLANYWAKKDWQITIVTNTDPESDFYELDPRIARVSLKCDRDSQTFVTAILNNLRRIKALRETLKRIRPDVAVGMMSNANSLLAFAGHGLRITLIGSERTHPPSLPLGRTWETIRRRSYGHLHALVAQTRQSTDWLHKNTSAPEIATIPNPASYPLTNCAPILQPQSLPSCSKGRYILLAVGRLIDYKGFDRLITIFATIAPQHPDWALVILGEGSARAELESKVAALGMERQIFMPGRAGNIGEWYLAAELYVLTSRFEGFPNTLLEALTYGCPAVAVDCETGPRDILRHEQDGLLVPQNDQAALANALTRLMSDRNLRTAFSQKAIEARDRFALNNIAAQWEALFDQTTRSPH